MGLRLKVQDLGGLEFRVCVCVCASLGFGREINDTYNGGNILVVCNKLNPGYR